MPSKSKSKCIFSVGKKNNLVRPAPLVLCGRDLPYVGQADHLGHVLTDKGDMEQDAAIKRARFIQSSVETRAMFQCAALEEVIKATKMYCGSFYGSNLWDIAGDKAKQVYNALSTTVKLARGCPQWTRTYIVQQLLCCGQTSARVDILSRYASLFQSLRKSSFHEVQVLSRLLARDIQSVTGKNLQFISDLSGLNPWTAPKGRLKATLIAGKTVEVPKEDRCGLPKMCFLLSQRGQAHNQDLEEHEERLTELIDSLMAN